MVDKKVKSSKKTDRKISSPKKTDKKVGSPKKTEKKVSSSKKTDNRNLLKKAWDFITKAECPKCKKSGGQKTHRKFIKAFDDLETVPYELEHTNKKGHYIGSTYGEEQVVIRTEIYNIYYRCDYCGHKWHKRDEETFQP